MMIQKAFVFPDNTLSASTHAAGDEGAPAMHGDDRSCGRVAASRPADSAVSHAVLGEVPLGGQPCAVPAAASAHTCHMAS
jgi:hypothetical protein